METMAPTSVPEEMLHLLPPLEENLALVPEWGWTAYIARHCTPYDYTEDSLLQKVYGRHALQVWLSSRGIKEANAGRNFICRKIGRMGIVIHSPLLRAKQTAEILMGYYFVGRPTFLEDVRLEDIRLGPWLDIPREDWTDHRRLYWDDQLKSLGLDGLNPENPYQTQQRMVESFFEHNQKHQRQGGLPPLFVSHGDPMSFLFQYLEKDSIMNLVGYREREGGKNVEKGTIWRVSLFPDKPVKIKCVFKPKPPKKKSKKRTKKTA